MRLELTRVGLLAELANHYTTRGAFALEIVIIKNKGYQVSFTKV